MKFNQIGIQSDENPQLLSDRARRLITEHRQRLQNRQQSMLRRAASEVGFDM
jgi:hypothetical protein